MRNDADQEHACSLALFSAPESHQCKAMSDVNDQTESNAVGDSFKLMTFVNTKKSQHLESNLLLICLMTMTELLKPG